MLYGDVAIRDPFLSELEVPIADNATPELSPLRSWSRRIRVRTIFCTLVKPRERFFRLFDTIHPTSYAFAARLNVGAKALWQNFRDTDNDTGRDVFIRPITPKHSCLRWVLFSSVMTQAQMDQEARGRH